MSRFSWLTKSTIWVAAGLIIGAGAGAGIGFLIVNLNEQNENFSYGPAQSDVVVGGDVDINIKEYDSGVRERQSIFGNMSETISVDGRTENVVNLGLDTLKYKIKHRLGYGPEIALLKNIVISPNGAWDEANGVFLGATNQIFINSTNIINSLEQIRRNIGGFGEVQAEIEFVAEYVFQIIAHEYNHHMAYTYLNSRFNPTTGSSFTGFTSQPTYVDVKGEKDNLEEAWDTDFYSVFTNTLNYDNSDVAKNQKFLDAYKVSYKQYYDGGREVEPISKHYTAGDIFKYANDNNVKNISRGLDVWNDKKLYAFYKDDQPAILYTQTDLAYQYSLAELYARKVQQLVMPTSLDYKATVDANGTIENYPLPYFRNVDPMNPTSNSPKMYGYDQLIWSDSIGQVRKGNWSPFLLDTKNYADDIYSVPFTSDYLYEGYRYKGSRNQSSGPWIYDDTNALKIYNAILNEMGYSGKNVKNNAGVSDLTKQADISEIWWNNPSEARTHGTFIPPKETDSFKMGGYVDKKYTKIGYFNSNGDYVPYDISVSNFTFGYKQEGLNGRKTMNNNGSKDSYFWTLKDFQNINNFKGKALAFGIDKNSYASELNGKIGTFTNEQTALTGQLATETDLAKLQEIQAKLDEVNIKLDDLKTELKAVQAITSKYMTVPVTSYNTEATTWLSLNSSNPKSGINSHMAYPTYDPKTYEVVLEVE